VTLCYGNCKLVHALQKKWTIPTATRVQQAIPQKKGKGSDGRKQKSSG
jgi:hypothetical protein